MPVTPEEQEILDKARKRLKWTDGEVKEDDLTEGDSLQYLDTIIEHAKRLPEKQMEELYTFVNNAALFAQSKVETLPKIIKASRQLRSYFNDQKKKIISRRYLFYGTKKTLSSYLIRDVVAGEDEVVRLNQAVEEMDAEIERLLSMREAYKERLNTLKFIGRAFDPSAGLKTRS
jgi:hypothetical protein